MQLKDRVLALRDRVQAAAERSGRSPDVIDVVAVTKTVPVEGIREAYECGLRVFGESRVQEAVEKIPQLPDDIEWHLIGHVQSNKVKHLPGLVSWVQSVDRPDIIDKLARRFGDQGQTVQVLLELNTSGESSKHGFSSLAEAHRAAGRIVELQALELRGAMTIGPLTENESEIRTAFGTLRRFFEELQSAYSELRIDTLSMGMSGDFEIAIEEGATMIRPGSVLFGPREM